MKRFLLKLSYTVLPLWIAMVGWYYYYYHVHVHGITGDLGELEQMYVGPEYREHVLSQSPDSLYYRNLPCADSVRVLRNCVLALGDSYSQYYSAGYLNALSLRGVNLVSLSSPADKTSLSPVQKAWELLELGYIDPSVTLLVETVERSLLRRLSELNPAVTAVTEAPVAPSRPAERTLIRPIDCFGKMIGLRTSLVRHVRLSRPFFSHSEMSEDLFFYSEDVTSAMSLDTEDPQSRTALDNLHRLYEKAAERHVKLIVLVPPDKYDLYQEYIVDNPYPRKTVNEDLRRLFPDSTRLVICKEILLPYVHEGRQDIYYLEDSHWSFYGADIVAGSILSLF